MSTDSAKRAFVQAAELAKNVPRHLQEIAFNRALDHLLGSAPKVKPAASNDSSTGARASETENKFLAGIDRTKYPDVGSTPRVADRALRVLHLANQDHGVDGLTAQEIS